MAPGVWLYVLLIMFPAVFVHLLLPILVGIKRIFPRAMEGLIERAGEFFSGTRGRVGILVYDALAMIYIVRYALRQFELAGVN